MSIDPPERRPRRGRRWAIAGLSLLGLLLAARAVAPVVLAGVVEARLGAALGVPVRVDDVDLRLWAGEAAVLGVRAAPADGTSASTVRVGAVHLRWRWADVLHGGPPVDVRVADVDVTLDLRAPWPAGPRRRAEAGLGPLRSLDLAGGRLAVVLGRDAAPVLTLADVAGTLREGAWWARGEAMTTQVHVTAGAGGGGTLDLRAALSPVRPQAAWTVHVELDRLDLRPLNPVWGRIFEMSVEAGALSVTADLTGTGGRLRGHLVPRFAGLVLLAPGERARHPMAEALFSTMLATADLPIEIDRPAGEGDEDGLALRLDEAFRTDAMELLRRVILRGYTRRLDALIGHDATIGGLEIDLPRGVLAFTDVVLRKTGGASAVPFLRVARLEVIVEPSVVDADATTYKAVVLHRPRFHVVLGRTEAGTQRSIDPDWQAKVSALPYPTDSLRVIDGEVAYHDETTHPPSRFVLSGLEVTAVDLARATAGRRGARVSARGLVMGEGSLRVEASFTPGGAPIDGELHLALAPVQLARLNGLLRSRFGVDVSSGTLGLAADLEARDGRVTGTITPALAEVSVLGVTETDITRPLLELVIERRLQRLDGVRLRIDVGGPHLLRGLPGALLRAIREAGARPRGGRVR